MADSPFRPRPRPRAADLLRAAVLRIDRSAALGLAVIAAVVLAITFVLVSRGRPHVVSVSGDGAPLGSSSGALSSVSSGAEVPSPASSSGSNPTASTGGIVVDVVGRVRRPGLVRLPPGSRVWDAVKAAGGFSHPSDAAAVNLAQLVGDGERIVVGPGGAGAVGAAGAVGGPEASGGSGPDAPVDLNTATLEELETLPDVGPVLAQRILDFRTVHGPFTAVNQLQSVSGIGDHKYADISPHVSV